MDAFEGVAAPPVPTNEPVLDYAPGSPERAALVGELETLRGAGPVELPMVIGGAARAGSGEAIDVVEPHRVEHVLGRTHEADAHDVADAVDAALAAAPMWRSMPFRDRAAVFLRAADLLAGPWRARFNAATMLGQSKSVFQSEIDAVCELCDFFRFNVADAEALYARQPHVSPRGQWNQMDHRPLEGFVLAISPFNFTSIAANLCCAPALMGNTVVWKPSPTQQLSASMILELLAAAGLPDGVINLVTGTGAAVSEVALVHPQLAGIHFTGSTATFRHLWRTVATNLERYRSFPRLVGETGGKDFVVAHPSADRDAVVTALLRGAFDYQGQKCSAASRAYLPRSFASAGVLDRLADEAASIVYGDVADLTAFGGAVIDRRSFDRLASAQQRLAADPTIEVIVGGTAQDKEGFFVEPTVVVGTDAGNEAFTTEFFGPILSVHVYEDARFDDLLGLVDSTSPYGLTGAVFATDRAAVARASEALRYAAGNFYVNDKPTGAVVGQQPFGGARASGTNDKAGSIANLERWVSPRTIKETFSPPTEHRYAHMARDEGVNPLRSAILAAARSERVRAGVESVGATRRVVDRFVAGESAADALECVHRLTGDGLLATVDHLGEEVTDAAGADATVDAYVALLDALGSKDLARGSDVSVKLTALGIESDPVGASARARRILAATRDAGATMTVDMEHSSLTDRTIATVRALREEDPSVAAVLQAMLRRTEADAASLGAEGARIRLCKGAYAEDADVAFQRRRDVDASYRRCLEALFSSPCTPLVATHDPAMVTAALELAASRRRGPADYELQMLLGVRPDEQLRLRGLGMRVRVYVPFGTQWWGYLMRRLAERPANVAFFARAVATRG